MATESDSTGDFNGDGITDMWVLRTIPNNNDGTEERDVTPYTSNGAGVLTQFAPTVLNNAPAGDYDGDGRSDYFDNGELLPEGAEGSPLNNIFPGDFDGDGCSDVLGWSNPSTVSYMCHPAVSSVLFDNTYFADALQVVDGFAQILTADFNGDGKTDVLILPIADNSLGSYSHTGSGGLVITYYPTLHPATLFLSTGTGFAPGIPLTQNLPWRSFTAASGDFNGDGKADLALIPLCPDPMAALAHYIDPLCTGAGGAGAPSGLVYLSTGTGFAYAATIASGGAKVNVADFASEGASTLQALPAVERRAVPVRLRSGNDDLRRQRTRRSHQHQI